MKLNADIIFDNLSQSIDIESYGRGSRDLALQRPEFITDSDREFKSNRIYISFAAELPQDPVIEDNVVIICVGGEPPVGYLKGNPVCFVSRDQSDLFSVFNSVQRVFDKFDKWESLLWEIVNTTADITKILEVSFPILGNPMSVIDSDYHLIAYSAVIDSNDELAIYRPDENGNLQLSNLSSSINSTETNMDMKKTFLIHENGTDHFSMNLFVKDEYVGNLTMPFILRKQRQSDTILAQYMGRMMEHAFRKHSKLLSNKTSALRNIVFDMLNGNPIDSVNERRLKNGVFSGIYIFVKMNLEYRIRKKVPTSYFFNCIEAEFPGSIAFEYKSSIICLINTTKYSDDNVTFENKMIKLLQNMHLKAGVSNLYTDLENTCIYYRQACIAFEMGSIYNADKIYHSFDDYILLYMMEHCLGEFPLEMFIASGLKKLVVHDIESQCDYILTLRTYLENNMSKTKTAGDLYLHRSTLMERLSRIERLLDVDLGDPDQRLRLHIILKALECDARLRTMLHDTGEVSSLERTKKHTEHIELDEYIPDIY